MLDTRALAAAMAPVIREAVDKAVADAKAPLLERLDALERRAPEKGEQGPVGEPGQRGQDGPPGSPGRDGKDCDMDAVMARVDEVLAGLPVPKDGADGRDGADADMEALKSHCADLIAAIPQPTNGRDGRDGDAGPAGERGADGKDGRDGSDGVGLAGAMIGRAGDLVVTLTNGEVKSLGPVVGTNGSDGKDGERGPEGFSLRHFDTEFRHADKTLVLKFEADDTLETHEIFIPYLRDMGVWKEGAAYLEGDGVTWGGSLWTAQKDTAAKPDGSDDWRLAVKRGRDGKDFAGPQPRAIGTVKAG